MSEKNTINSALATAFLAMVDHPKIATVQIDGLGPIGIREMNLKTRDEWLEKTEKDKKNQTIFLLQSSVCEPETGELVLNQLTVEQLQGLPMNVINSIVTEINQLNGFKTKEQIEAEKAQNGGDSEQLKNSETNQS